MEARLENIFRCGRCGFWYLREEEGPWGDCKLCYWGIPIDRKVAGQERTIAVMMARELEELLPA